MHGVLAARTDFSMGESILTTEALVEAAKDAGETTVALTDTMSVTGMIDFTNRAKRAGIKPVIGVRLALTDNPNWTQAKGEKKKHMPPHYFMTAYVLTEVGMKAIFRLLTLGNSDDRFYYFAKLGFEDLYAELNNLGPNDLAFHLGDERSLLAHPDITNIVSKLQKTGSKVYAPLVPVNTPYYGRMNKISCELISNLGLDPIVIRPCFYKENEADAQEIMNGIIGRTKISEPWFRSRYVRNMHLCSMKDMKKDIVSSIKHLSERGISNSQVYFSAGIKNTGDLVDSVSYEWLKADVSLPDMAPDEFRAVTDECAKGWKLRFGGEIFGHKPSAQNLKEIYMPRLKYELSVLKKLNFSGYFLLVQDIVRFAKENDIIVGPGRGSVGGSLVAYLMGITDCDPIRFDLMFERFINPDRIDLPDADLDFMSARRHEVIEYIISKYGQGRVAGVSNFGTLAAASAIRDVGRVTEIPEREYSVSKMVPKKHGQNIPLAECREQVPEIDDFATRHAGVWPVMERLEGTIRNLSSHAAGVVVSGVDLTDRAVIERRKDASVVCWDKRIVEDQGLVKVDILGLATLDIIGQTLDYIRERHGKRIDINKIPLDDPKVLKEFALANTTGVFQFESGGMRRLLRELGCNGSIDFEDITAATALYRPGPMESGMMDSFFKRKQGEEAIEYDHPLMEEVLRNTFGVIVYQEQVMKISQVIAGYSGAEADKLRKIMGKKLPEEMAKERDRFVRGCVDTINCEEGWAGKLFDKIEGFAGYGFNRSHSIEYTLISYQAMWLKVNYPVEFYAAGLTLMDEDKLPGLIKDANDAGILVGMPDINNSTKRFEIVTDKMLVIPFQRIKGISEKTADAIIEARNGGKFADKNDFLSRVEKRRCNVRHQDALERVGAFASIDATQKPSNDPERIKDQIELIPGLISSNVPVYRSANRDQLTKEAVNDLVREYRSDQGTDGLPCKPSFGRSAKFMIISDAPSNQEDIGGLIGFSKSNDAVLQSMDKHGFEMRDCYWTSLLKRPKKGRMITLDEIKNWNSYLDREINLLNPPVIVMLGSTTTRYFLPDFRGKASDQAGKVVYNSPLDLNLVVAFSPGEIYHAPEKQANMDMVFASVAKLLK